MLVVPLLGFVVGLLLLQFCCCQQYGWFCSCWRYRTACLLRGSIEVGVWLVVPLLGFVCQLDLLLWSFRIPCFVADVAVDLLVVGPLFVGSVDFFFLFLAILSVTGSASSSSCNPFRLLLLVRPACLLRSSIVLWYRRAFVAFVVFCFCPFS